jgi:hypothetical protein
VPLLSPLLPDFLLSIHVVAPALENIRFNITVRSSLCEYEICEFEIMQYKNINKI